MRKSIEEQDNLLRELRENICDEVLNFYDSSVGLFPYYDLRDWVGDNKDSDDSDIRILTLEPNEATFECEGRTFIIRYEQVDAETWEWTLKPLENAE